MKKSAENKMSPLNVCSLALGCIIGWGAFVMPGNVFLPKAGPVGASCAIIMAALVMIIIACNYSYMINKYPVAGGECIYAQELFGKNHAYLCGWFLGLSYLSIVPLNATALNLLTHSFWGKVLQKGYLYHFANDDIYLGELLIPEAIIILFAIISIHGVKISGRVQTVLCFMIVGGITLILLAAIFKGNVHLSQLHPFFGKENNKWLGVVSVFAVMPWAFVGFDTIPQATEEINFSVKKTRALMILAILFGAFVYISLTIVTAGVVPDGFSSWQQYILKSHELEGVLALPTFHAADQLLGKIGLVTIVVAVIGAILSGVMGFYMATSRLLFALAKEKFIPIMFTKKHTKYNTPSCAIWFVCMISMIAPFMGRTALGWIVDMSSLGAAIGYGYTSAATMKFSLEEKKMKTFVTGLIGSFFSVCFVILLIVPIKGLECHLSKQAYICLLIWIVIGAIFYMVKRRGN